MPLDRPVILLHGWTMRGALFGDLCARLGEGARAPDLPGHGADRCGPASLEAAVDMLDAEVARAGPEALVVGWSMGAAVAWAWLGRRGGTGAAGLVTVDMSPRPVNCEGWELGLLGQTPERLRRNTEEIHSDWPAAAEKIATTMFADKAGAPGFSRAEALAQVLSNDPGRMAAYWDDMMAMDLREAARDVRIPWRVAHGARSRVYPAGTAEWLAEGGAARVTFEQSGHSPHLEEPEAFAEMIRSFDAELSGR
ncbi:alpha/beta fold hydrolase [Histidinibacterium aquaticum]|uniref:Alpha/beta hydrolase n=1 Tax=Histidinibacterium aquaticum TaxID=2613962 RepID=A0A5J5GI30_9RHOB|nr:alpha/beta hydrolase [Histidinibacterium aquaticum]KAA9007886.1 alpha/beta hydrolase [Histidinibacterium aquaticum]